MNLYQSCIETYDSYIGTNREPLIDGVPWRPMAPVGHTVVTPDIEIAISPDGKFIDARTPDKKCVDMVVIPVTETSRGRSGASVRPHCLCDKADYVLPPPEGKKAHNAEFMRKLREWEQSEYTHPSVTAVLRYLEGGSVIGDLIDKGLDKEIGGGVIYFMVCSKGKGLFDDGSVNWRDVSARYDEELINCHIKRYLSLISAERGTELCELTGESTIPAENNFPKGVVRCGGNAKVMSVNFNEFTFLGENFVSEKGALSAGYVNSQKFHNALQWEFTRGMLLDTRAFALWYLVSEGKKLRISAIADVSTTGRTAITYYNICEAGEGEEESVWKLSIGDIPMRTLVDLAYGSPIGVKDKQRIEAPDTLKNRGMQDLITYYDGNGEFPMNITRAIVLNAGNLSAYSKRNRGLLLKAACMCISLTKGEVNKESRDYMYGSLFAILEQIETRAFPGKDDSFVLSVQRELCGRPRRAFKKLYKRIKEWAYPKFERSDRDPRGYYEKLISELYVEDAEGEPDRPLNEDYLVGYNDERQNLYTQAPKGEDNAD